MKNNFVEVYDNALSDEICDELVGEFEYLDSLGETWPGTIGASCGDSEIVKELKDSQDVNLMKLLRKWGHEDTSPVLGSGLPYGEIFQAIADACRECLTKYDTKYEYFANFMNLKDIGYWHNESLPKKRNQKYINSLFEPTDSLLLKRYRKGVQGYHRWHSDLDDSSSKTVKRSHVIQFYLNDVSEGGETEFYHQKLKIKPKKGTAVVFPTYYTHMHRGNIPLSNDKYILNTWPKPAYRGRRQQ